MLSYQQTFTFPNQIFQVLLRSLSIPYFEIELSQCKDKLEDMDASLIKEGVRVTGGHYFQDLFTAKPLDIQNFLGYQMKDLDIVFPRIPHNTL